MRLTSLDNSNPRAQPGRIPRKRRRRTQPSSTLSTTSSSSPSPSPPLDTAVETPKPDPELDDEVGSASASDDDEDEKTRLTNAYPGATNSIGSIHQRRWFITLDRESSGFEPVPSTASSKSSGKKTWVRKRSAEGELLGFEPFYVRGPEVERSVVTGRLAREVLEDEGVEGFVRRRGWRPVLE